jgi:hypothetical protein
VFISTYADILHVFWQKRGTETCVAGINLQGYNGLLFLELEFKNVQSISVRTIVNLYPHLPSASGKCPHNLCLKGECTKTTTEKHCYAHLPSKPAIMNICPINVHFRPLTHYSRNISID